MLFFCTFIALRSEDTVREVIAIADSELHGEKELFGGYVQSCDLTLCSKVLTHSTQENRR